jgi:hypothetical protein
MVDVPRGFRELARHKAEREGLAISEFLRRALYEMIDGDRPKANGKGTSQTSGDA